MKNWITNNFWIKITSLILAVIAWFYVNGEVRKEKDLTRRFYNSSRMEHTRKHPLLEKMDMNKDYQKRK